MQPPNMKRDIGLLIAESKMRLQNIEWIAQHGSLALKMQILHALQNEGR